MGLSIAATIATVLTVTPANGGLVTPTHVTINNQLGDQYDPHVDLDLAAYSNSIDSISSLTEEIRYYRFSTGVDSAIPHVLSDGAVARDLLSDVDQGRIVFTRIFPGDRTAIMLFDATTQLITELAPAPASNRIGVALGAQTVAFIDYSLTSNGSGELMVLDLATSSVSRLTTDTVFDLNPAVSPDGSVITWARCESFANCDIYRAQRVAGTWLTQSMSSSIFNERSADTNGTLVAFERYEPTGATGSNVVLMPVAGGTETVLELPGEQFNPSIRDDIVVFESRVDAASNSDIFLMKLSSNQVFQVTQTPLVNESLNDVTVLPSGEVRLVWQANDEDGVKGNIYGATFALTQPSPPDAGTSSCGSRDVSLEATRFYSPTRSVDGEISFQPPMRFAIPSAIPVTAGNAGNKKAILSIDLGSKTLRCEYRGGAKHAHPSNPAELALASRYFFSSCKVEQDGPGKRNDRDESDHCDERDDSWNSRGRNDAFGVGTPVTAYSVRLHIQNGDTTKPLTRVAVALNELCSTSSIRQHLEVDPGGGNNAAGCSGTGASLTPLLAGFALMALVLRRRKSPTL